MQFSAVKGASVELKGPSDLALYYLKVLRSRQLTHTQRCVFFSLHTVFCELLLLHLDFRPPPTPTPFEFACLSLYHWAEITPTPPPSPNPRPHPHLPSWRNAGTFLTRGRFILHWNSSELSCFLIPVSSKLFALLFICALLDAILWFANLNPWYRS